MTICHQNKDTLDYFHSHSDPRCDHRLEGYHLDRARSAMSFYQEIRLDPDPWQPSGR